MLGRVWRATRAVNYVIFKARVRHARSSGRETCQDASADHGGGRLAVPKTKASRNARAQGEESSLPDASG
jgi:hypothetical protein